MGNTSSSPGLTDSPYFLVERTIGPNVKVGAIGGKCDEKGEIQGIRIGNGKIRRLKTFKTILDNLHYTFENATTLSIYQCGHRDVCYTLMCPDIQEENVFYEKIPQTFKPISLGDATKDIDAIAKMFEVKN